MGTHKIHADLDVDGEVQGTSLDINGNADISGGIASGDRITITRDSDALRLNSCLLYTSPSPRDATLARMPSSA